MIACMQTPRKPIPFTFEERQKIEQMLKEQQSLSFICQILDRDFSVINREIWRGGGRENYSAMMATHAFAKNRQRAMQGRKRIFTPEEKALIQQMVDQNKSKRLMRAALNCNYTTIHNYIKNNFPNYKGGVAIELTERIEILEKQLKLMFELIKEIKSDQKN